MKKNLLFLAFLSTILLMGHAVFAQVPTVSYSPQTNVFTYGTAITALTPNVTNGPITGYSIDNPLPAGLSFDTSTGIISGTPTSIAAAADFNITATNSSGPSAPFTINIAVNPAPLTITADNQSKIYGTANPALTVTYSGLVNGDTPASLSTPPTVTTTATNASGVGTYPVTPTGAVDNNYTISYSPGVLTVNAAPLTITANDANKTYGTALTGGPGSTAFTSSGLVGSETIGSITITYGTGSAATDPVTTYTGTITASAATGGTFNPGNYTINYVPGNIIVGQATLTITANVVNKTYGTALISGAGSTAFSSTALQNGETVGSVTIAYGTGAAANAPVGTYTNSVTPSAATGGTFSPGNYNITYTQNDGIVGQANLTITANLVNKIYGATLTVAPGSTAFTPTGLQNGETIGTVTITYGAGGLPTAAVGTYTGSATPSLATGGTFTAGNYNITYTAGNLVVGQAPLVITANNVNKTYGATLTGAAGSTAFSSIGLQNGQTIGSITIAYGTGSASTAPVGTYTGSVTASAATGGTFTPANYSISYVQGNIVVGQATLIITANLVNKTYGTALTGATGSTAFTSTGLQGGETIGSVTITYGTGALAAAAPATYTGQVTPSAATGGTFTASNYNITYASNNIVVSKATLVITANSVSKVFGTALTGGAGSTAFTSTGLQNGQTIGTVTIAYSTGATAASNVGTYTASVTASAATGGTFVAADYTVTYVQANITVTPATLTITANNNNKIYGATLTNVTNSAAFTYSGQKNGNTVLRVNLTFGTGAAATAPVGTYTGQVTPSGASGGTFTASNYNIVYVSGDIIVGKATITINANNVNKTYGTAISGGAGSTAFTITGALQNGETITSVTITDGTGAAATAVVGTYTNQVVPLSPVGTFTASNYTININPGDIIVGKALLTVTADNQTRVYGAADPAFTLSYSGFKNGDNSSVLNTVPTGSTTATTTSNVGSYPITAAGGADNNYNFTYVSGTLTITQASLLITTLSQSRTQGTNSILTASYTGLTGGDTQADLTTQPTITTTATVTSPPGTYPISASGAVDNNYIITYSNTGILTITPPGPNIYDWTGVVSTDWANPQNWNISGAQQTVNYPGLSAAGDVANIGVNYDYTLHQPVLSFTLANNVGALTFGDNNVKGVSLVVNSGVILSITGAVTQMHNGNNASIVTALGGGGTLTCASFAVGDNTKPQPPSGYLLFGVVQIGGVTPANYTTTFNCGISNLIVSGNLTLNSTTSVQGSYTETFATIKSYCTNNPVFNLQTGSVTANNVITSNSNYVNVTPDPLVATIVNTDNYYMDLSTAANTLTLLGATPLTVATGATFHFVGAGTAALSTVNYAATSGTQKVYSTADAGITTTPTIYAGLSLTAAAAKTVDGGTITTGGNIISSGGPVNLNTNNPVITVGTTALPANWTNNANVTQGSANITITGTLTNGSNTFQLGTGSLTTANVQNNGGTISGGAGPGTVTVSTAFNNQGGLYQCNAENIFINGSYLNTSAFTGGTGTVYFNKAGAQALIDNSVSPAGTMFTKVNFQNSGVKTMSGTGSFVVSSTGVLTMAGTASLAAGGVLTLNSSAASSASVAAIPATCSITGNVNVQRFVTGGAGYRGYRLMSSPVYGTSIASNKVYSLNYLINSIYLRGTSGIGFDGVGNDNIYLFRENIAPSATTFTSGNYNGINSLGTTNPNFNYPVDGNTAQPTFTIPQGNGILVFFRGDRNADTYANEIMTSYLPTNTIITATGTLNQGTVSPVEWYTPASPYLGWTNTPGNSTVQGFNMVGNPYASTIDLNTASTTAGAGIQLSSTNVKTTFYELNTVPPYNQQYAIYDPANSGNNTNNSQRFISSGQGFFVVAIAAGQSITFNEAAKTTLAANQPSGAGLFMAERPVMSTISDATTFNGNGDATKRLRLTIKMDSTSAEDAVVAFNETASANYVQNVDALYKQGTGKVSMSSISADNQQLAINILPINKKSTTTIPLYVSAVADGTYSLNLTEIKNIPAIYEVWLMDAYAKDSLQIRQNPTYSFNIAHADTNTFGSKRFTLVIRENALLAYHLLKFDATKAINGSKVTWNIENEQNYTGFTVQRTNDNGKNFDNLGVVPSNSGGNYSYLDTNPLLGTDGYRLQITDLLGNISYSKIVPLLYSKLGDNITKNTLTIYPNPTIGAINVAVSQQINSTSFDIQIVNSGGMMMKKATSPTANWQSDVSKLLPGTYVIQIVNNKDKSIVGKGTFVKL